MRDLTDAVSALTEHLMPETAAGAGAFGTGHAPWCWRGLDDDAAERLWRDLVEWVAWLRGRYPIAEQLPACWPQYPELVEELTALRAAWNVAYLST